MPRKFSFSKTRLLGIVLIAFGVLLLAWFAISRQAPPPPPPPPPPASESEPSAPPPSISEEPLPAPSIVYPTGTMFVTPERLHYQAGEMVLRVPRLGLSVPLGGEVSQALQQKLLAGSATKEEQSAYYGNAEGDKLLKLGPVLLNNATLPGKDIVNSNVSISGHRDIDGCEFYYIDTITTGDRIYLEYQGNEYVYAYAETVIREANDWSITYCKDESVVTLISCDPIGTSRNRIVVTGKLIEIRPLTGEGTELPQTLIVRYEFEDHTQAAPPLITELFDSDDSVPLPVIEGFLPGQTEVVSGTSDRERTLRVVYHPVEASAPPTVSEAPAVSAPPTHKPGALTGYVIEHYYDGVLGRTEEIGPSYLPGGIINQYIPRTAYQGTIYIVSREEQFPLTLADLPPSENRFRVYYTKP